MSNKYLDKDYMLGVYTLSSEYFPLFSFRGAFNSR